MNIPNALTVFRIFLIPIFLLVYLSNPEENLSYSVLIYVLAGVTDFFDGYIARKKNIITTFGTVMDPLADKLMLLTALISYTITQLIPLWIFLVVAAKEIFMIVGGFFVYKKGIINPANKLGKFVTLTFHLSIVVLFFHQRTAIYLLILAAVLGIVASARYVKMSVEKNKAMQ